MVPIERLCTRKRQHLCVQGHDISLSEVVDYILDLRQRRSKAPAKRTFDKNEIKERGKHYDKKADNFLDYSDMNMRYLRI